LVVGQSESPTTELLLEDSVLLSEVLDDRILPSLGIGLYAKKAEAEETAA
jgi:hypothetical protein